MFKKALLIVLFFCSLPVALMGTELHYNAKEYSIFHIPLSEGKGAVQYREWIDKDVITITIEGRTTKNAEISIRLKYDERTGEEESKMIIIVDGEPRITEFNGIMTAIYALRNKDLRVGQEREMEVLTKEKGVYWLVLKIEETRNLDDGVLYLTTIELQKELLNKGKQTVTTIDLWIIKGGEMDGCIAKIEMRIGFIQWLELTLIR